MRMHSNTQAFGGVLLQVQRYAALDAVVTVVDAKHIIQHLDEEKPEGVENESVEQVGRPLQLCVLASGRQGLLLLRRSTT